MRKNCVERFNERRIFSTARAVNNNNNIKKIKTNHASIKGKSIWCSHAPTKPVIIFLAKISLTVLRLHKKNQKIIYVHSFTEKLKYHVVYLTRCIHTLSSLVEGLCLKWYNDLRFHKTNKSIYSYKKSALGLDCRIRPVGKYIYLRNSYFL